MKTKLAYLVFLPALLLSSCGNGQALSEEERDKAVAAVSEKSGDLANVEATISMTSAEYDEETKKSVTTKTNMTYRANANEEAYLKSSATRGEEKSESEVYLVQNETYQQVLYTKTYDAETKKDVIEVYGYEGNELTFTFSALYFMVPQMYISMFADPAQLDVSGLVSDDESGREYNVTTNYYSSGEGQLTIKVNAKVKGEVKKDEEEFTTTANFTVEYAENHLKSVDGGGTSNKGNKSSIKMNVTVKENVTITLPSGWEELINKSSSSLIDFGGDDDESDL